MNRYARKTTLGALATVVVLLSCIALPSRASGTGPHNDIMLNTRIRCSDCHETISLNELSPEFNDSTDEVCKRCHRRGEGAALSHPVGMKVKTAFPRGIPLSSDGRLMCITCHTFHTASYLPVLKKRVYLRKGVLRRDFCNRCHGQDPSGGKVVSY